MTNGILTLDDSQARSFLGQDQLNTAMADAYAALRTLNSRSGAGSDFLGWLDLPETAVEDIPRIEAIARRIREQSDVLVVVGIGGSYLGARAAIEACVAPFADSGPEILYAGHFIDGDYLQALLEYLEDKRVAVNVISKSGTTTEPALAFRVLRTWMVNRYGREEAAKRIVATTDAARGALRRLADEEGYETFIIPDDVGGRFSVLTPVGLLPIAAAGVDIRAMIAGAKDIREQALSENDNPAMRYAAVRMALLRTGRSVEVLAAFQPRLQYVSEWWKQLFGESEGKNGGGIFPAAVVDTTDLHSMGQYIQDGTRMLFETFLVVDRPAQAYAVPDDPADLDGLNFLAGTDFSEVNRKAWQGTALAHASGGVPTMTLHLRELTSHSIGALFYFFEVAVALGGYMLGVNPFDQPGVEEYKRNMFALLGKPGYESVREDIERRLRGSD